MSTTQALNRFGVTLDLKVDDEHTYSVNSPSIKVGAWLVESANVMTAAQSYTDEDEIPEKLQAAIERVTSNDVLGEAPLEQYKTILGDAFDEMVEDGMPFEVVQMAVGAVVIWVQSSRQEAMEFWNRGGRVPPTNRTQRRKKTTSRAT